MLLRRLATIVALLIVVTGVLLAPHRSGLASADWQVHLPLVSAGVASEGELNVIALPRDWCRYGAVIDGFERAYGIQVNELDPTASSSDELQAIRDHPDGGPLAPDVIDVGLAFGEQAKAEGLLQPYKVRTWANIPNAAKDADGYWYGDYFGLVAFMVNQTEVANAPQSWVDLRQPAYSGQVALSGDPHGSNQAFLSVQAASLANGGTVADPMPGLEFFRDIYASGNLTTVIASNDLVASGATPIRITWDYLALAGADIIGADPLIAVVAPQDGLLAGLYVQAISAYAPHPNAARLWMEYLYSDEGQLAWMAGYCHPVREADLRARGVVPADLADQMPDASGAVFPTSQQLTAGRQIIVDNWDAIVGAEIHAPGR